MKDLKSILSGDELSVKGSVEVMISGMTFDSRQVKPGWLFAAIPGNSADGRKFIDAAVKAGASAILTEGPIECSNATLIIVKDTRRALSKISKRFFEDPSSRSSLIGITGTKGKTTTTYLVQAILKQCHEKVFRLGTIEYDLGFETRPAKNTTPESLTLFSLLHEAVEHGAKQGVIEVSSHGLKTSRVEDLNFAGACFTNLSLEHTEFHPDMEDYYQAKSRLFFDLMSPEKPRIVCIDDEYGRRLADEIRKAGSNLRTVSIEDPSADYFAGEISRMNGKTCFRITGPEFEIPVEFSLTGKFNVSNAVVAAAICLETGLMKTSGGSDPAQLVSHGLASIKNVPGRFEAVENSRGLTVVVDYAHSPASLQNVLEAARALTRGRLITVFGCGGERSPDKRPLMGGISSRLSDITIVTSDNPRSEQPEEIVKQILSGVEDLPGKEVRYEVDRKKAIRQAISMATPEDVVIIAGKGHETGQTFKDIKIPFDDREVARSILEGETDE